MIGICDVCGEQDVEVGVACSPLVAMSFAYCDYCLKAGLEPWTTFLCTVDPSCALEEYTPWFQALLKRNLEFHGKTIEDLRQAALQFAQEYAEYLASDEAEQVRDRGIEFWD